MNLRIVRIIALKELRDVLRDRRTLIFMMLLPIAVMPLMMIGLMKFVVSQQQAKADREIVVAADATTQATLTALGSRWVADHRDDWTRWLGLKVLLEFKTSGALDLIYDSEGDADEASEDVTSEVEPANPGDETAEFDDDEVFGAKLAAKMFKREEVVTPQWDDPNTVGLARARAVERFMELTDFVDPAALNDGTLLNSGVEIPAGVHEALAQERLAGALQSKEVELVVYLEPGALTTLDEVEGTVNAHMLYDSSISMSEEAEERFDGFISAIDSGSMEMRVFDAGQPEHFADPIRVERANVATKSRKIQAALGGILPYLLLAFAFFGALYPAMDLTAGEKERFTLETLLLAPASRFEIALGKFLVVFLAAIVAALLTTSSMAVTFTQGILPPEMSQQLDIRFEPLAIALTISMILPVAAMYAAALLAIGLIARSFKEAQSYSVPLQFLFVLPSMVSLIPDLDAEPYLAWIPFVNISMLIRELLKGNYLWDFYGITMLSTLLLTLGTLWVAAWLFRRESVMLRA